MDRNRRPSPETEVAEGLHDDRWFDERVRDGCDLIWCPGFVNNRFSARLPYMTVSSFEDGS